MPASQAAQETQNRFVSDNLRRIFLLIYRIVGNVADAQDLTQEAFIKALQRQDQLKEMDKAAHWLSRIASNTAIDFLRRNGKVNFCEIDSLVEPLTETDRESRAGRTAVGASGASGTGLERAHRARKNRAAAARRGRIAGRGGGRADELLQGHGALAYRQRAHQVPALYGTEPADLGKEAVMKHPNEIQLALLAGGDLAAWDRWRVRRHCFAVRGM